MTFDVDFLVPRMVEYGGIQRYASDAAKSLLARDTRADIVDLGCTKKVQLRRLSQRAAHELVRRRLRPPSRKYLLHHWHLRSASFPLLPVDVLTCHGNELLDPRYEAAAERSLSRARMVVTPSSFTRDLVVRIASIDSDRVAVVHPGVELAAPDRDQKSLPRRDSGVLRIGTLARLTGRKNVRGIAAALGTFRAEWGTRFEYHLAGDGPDRDVVLRELDRLQIPYTYWGSISDVVKASRFLPQLDIFVLPTLATPTDVEGFGIVYIEANSHGVPVVASQTGGVADAVKEGISGVFVDPADGDSIAEGISVLASKLSQMSISSMEWSRRFSLDAMGVGLEEVYCRAAGVERRP